MIGDERVLMQSTQPRAFIRQIRRRATALRLAPPFDISELYREKANEIVTILKRPEGTISEKRPYTTNDLSIIVGIDPPAIQHHLRTLRREGYRIPNPYSEDSTEDFRQICSLILERKGQHGRREKKK